MTAMPPMTLMKRSVSFCLPTYGPPVRLKTD